MRLAFGRYMPTNSIIHRMDPRLKLIMIMSLMISVFFPIGFTGLISVGIVSLILLFFSKLSLKVMLKIFRPVIFILIIMLIVNVFIFSPGKHAVPITEHSYSFLYSGQYADYGYYVRIHNTYLTESSVYKALYMSLRIFLTIQFATILTGTTQPVELTLAIEYLLAPLKLIGIPIYIFSTIISIALRMIPTLIDEAGRIMKAQSSRGIDFKNGKLSEKAKSIVSLIIPLLVSSFQKAEDLAYAMDARGYNPHGKRTRYRQQRIKFSDVIIFLFFVSLASLFIAYPFVPELNQFRIPRIDDILGILA